MGNEINGIEKHHTENIDESYSEDELKVLNKLGLSLSDIKSKKNHLTNYI